MSMMMKPLNNKFIKTLLDYQFVVPFKATMPLYLHMDRLVQAKLTLCRDLDTTCMMMNEVLYPEQYKIFSGTFNLVKTKM